MIKVISFEHIMLGHIYFIVHHDGIYRSTSDQTTYTLKEAMESTELLIDAYEIINE